MKYMGSKSRIAKQIVNAMSDIISIPATKTIVELFCGGLNMTNELVKFGKPIICVDNNPYLIAMYKSLMSGWEPPDTITRDQYNDIKNNHGNYEPELVGFVGFGCSFGAKWWGGYATGGKKESHRNYAIETKNHLQKQFQNFKDQDITFIASDYKSVFIPTGSVIYCDPPYINTTNYHSKFDHDDFWNWVRRNSREFPIYVSEYESPNDFVSILDIPIITRLNKNLTTKNVVEKLFLAKL